MNSLKKLITINLKNPWKYNSINTKRLFFSPAVLGIDSFLKRKQDFHKENYSHITVLKRRLKEACAEGNKALLFPNDLINMIYLAEDNEDLEEVHKMFKKLNSQTLVKVQRYNTGPDIMRLHYVMNKPAEAMLLVKDPVLCSEFKTSTSFLIFLDLLFENNLFDEIITMYSDKVGRPEENYLSNFINKIFFAACYKQNTEESFQAAFRAWQVLLKLSFMPGPQIRLLFAALSLNQNQLFCAMEVLPYHRNNVLSENLKCIIMAKSKRFQDAFDCLNHLIRSKNEESFILKETLTAVEEEVRSSTEENIIDFRFIKEDSFMKNKVKDESLETSLCVNAGLWQNKASGVLKG